MSRIRVAQPVLAGNERRYVLDCLDSNWISSNGKYIAAFEEAFARFCGVPHAVAVSSGTAALHLALIASGVSPGDEVIVPTLTYVATANAVRYCGATPVLVDVARDTKNIDPVAIERAITKRTRVIIPVHLYGHPADMPVITDIARRNGLVVVEDAAEAHGAAVQGRRAGALGSCAAFSFFGNKIVTTGEGGMVTTSDSALAERLRLYRGQGMDPARRYWFPVVGFNYRMTNLQAAIGLGQMETIERALAARRRLAGWYDEALSSMADVERPRLVGDITHAYWMYTIWLRRGGARTRDAIMDIMDRRGVETRPAFYPLHTLPPYRLEATFPVADRWAARGISLPTHEAMTRADVDRVVEALRIALAVGTGRTRVRPGAHPDALTGPGPMGVPPVLGGSRLPPGKGAAGRSVP